MKKISFIIFLIFSLTGSLGLSADVIILKNSEKLTGIIKSENNRELVLELSYGRVTLKKSEIREIHREDRVKNLLAISQEYLLENKFDPAIENLTKLLADPDVDAKDRIRRSLIKAYLEKINYLANHLRYADALAEIEKAISIDPSNKELPEYRSRMKNRLASLETAFEKGVILHDLGNFESSINVLLPLYENEPSFKKEISPILADSYLRIGRKYFKDGSFAEALAAFDKALAITPELSAAVRSEWIYCNLQKIIAYLNEKGADVSPGELRAFSKKLEELAGFAPDNIHLHYVLGVISQRLGRDEAALKQFLIVTGEKAPQPPASAHLDELRKRADDLIAKTPLAFEYTPHEVFGAKVDFSDMQSLEGRYFIIHYYNAEIARRALGIADYFAGEVARRLLGEDLRFSQKCELYIFKDADEYSKVAGRPPWTTGHTIFTRAAGQPLVHKILTYQTATDLLRAVIPHEVTHAVTNEAVGFRGRLPLWFKEGLALMQEPDYRRSFFYKAVTDAAELGTLMPFSDVISMKDYPQTEEVNRLFYAESLLLVEVLVEGFPASPPLRFARSLSEKSLTDALRQSYNINTARLKRLWQERIGALSSAKQPL